MLVYRQKTKILRFSRFFFQKFFGIFFDFFFTFTAHSIVNDFKKEAKIHSFSFDLPPINELWIIAFLLFPKIPVQGLWKFPVQEFLYFQKKITCTWSTGFPRFRSRRFLPLSVIYARPINYFRTGIPVQEFPYRKIPVQEIFFFWKSLYRKFPNTKKRGGEHHHLLFGSPPFAKTHWIFFVSVLDQKKMEWGFCPLR